MRDFDVSCSGQGPWKPLGYLEHEEVQLMLTSQFCWWEAPVAKPSQGFSCRVGACLWLYVQSSASIRAGIAAGKDALGQSLCTVPAPQEE